MATNDGPDNPNHGEQHEFTIPADMETDRIREAALAVLPVVMSNPQAFIAPPALVTGQPQAIHIDDMMRVSFQIGQRFEMHAAAFARSVEKAKADLAAGVGATAVPDGKKKGVILDVSGGKAH